MHGGQKKRLSDPHQLLLLYLIYKIRKAKRKPRLLTVRHGGGEPPVVLQLFQSNPRGKNGDKFNSESSTAITFTNSFECLEQLILLYIFHLDVCVWLDREVFATIFCMNLMSQTSPEESKGDSDYFPLWKFYWIKKHSTTKGFQINLWLFFEVRCEKQKIIKLNSIISALKT